LDNSEKTDSENKVNKELQTKKPQLMRLTNEQIVIASGMFHTRFFALDALTFTHPISSQPSGESCAALEPAMLFWRSWFAAAKRNRAARFFVRFVLLLTS
jgi:hypothetical protein